MKRFPILLLLLCGCTPAQEAVNGSDDGVGDLPVGFVRTKTPLDAGDAVMTEFHYLTYDYGLGAWSGELGGLAQCGGDASALFLPADASRVYWPEGKIYSFYAAGYNENATVQEADVEFGTSMILYNSGTSAILTLKNPGHNVDWMAAKDLRQSKIAGIPLSFKHVCPRISGVVFDVSGYREWIEARELDVASIVSLWCTITDADEQTFIYSTGSGTLFARESQDYRSSPARGLDGRRDLVMAENGTSFTTAYYAFPGMHTFSMRVQLLDIGGNQVIDDRILSGDITLPMNSDCELTVTVNPWDRDLEIRTNVSLVAWELGGYGTVEE